MEKVKFKTNKAGSLFYEDLKCQVNRYFTDNNISPTANNEMKGKCILLITFWIASWALIIVFKDYFLIAFLIGIGHMLSHLLIAFNIAHDANHFALFKSKKLNHFFGYFMEIIGCNKKMWVIGHNQEHHTFINIHEHDTNIDGYKLLRLTPADEWRAHHRFQHYYATLLYALSTLNYATFRDFKMLHRHVKHNKIKLTISYLSELLFFKIFYYLYLFIIPIFVFQVPFVLILSFFLVGHLIIGMTLAFVFLTGHLTEETHYPPITGGDIENNWAVHVIRTTGDYAPTSRFLHWFTGGLNLHVAHHLFPKICHVHYNKIAPIIKEVANRHGLVYREIPKFKFAVASHFRLLRELGRNSDESISIAGSGAGH
jgi:linoleoyl-CoA desaturase